MKHETRLAQLVYARLAELDMNMQGLAMAIAKHQRVTFYPGLSGPIGATLRGTKPIPAEKVSAWVKALKWTLDSPEAREFHEAAAMLRATTATKNSGDQAGDFLVKRLALVEAENRQLKAKVKDLQALLKVS